MGLSMFPIESEWYARQDSNLGPRLRRPELRARGRGKVLGLAGVRQQEGGGGAQVEGRGAPAPTRTGDPFGVNEVL